MPNFYQKHQYSKNYSRENINKVVTQDLNDKLHFHSSLTNGDDLIHVLDQIAKDPELTNQFRETEKPS